MPDQNSAASEHALMQEITQPLAELPDDPVAAVANVDFPLALRGYDRGAVDDHMRRTAQLVAELYSRRSPEGAVRRALERVGKEVSSILARAHETAEEITSRSRAEAEDRLMQARAEAEELERDARAEADQLQRDARAEAQELERNARALADQLERDSTQKVRELQQAGEVRVHELDSEVDRIWAERERIVSDMRKLSENLSELAGAAAARFPAATTDEAAAVTGPDSGDGSSGAQAAVAGPGEGERSAVWQPALGAKAESEPVGDAEPDFGGEPEAELHEVPADVGGDPFATVEHDADSAMSLAEQPTSVFQRPRMRVIDLHHLGRERVIGCWQVDEVLIDPGPASCLDVLLAALEGPPKALLLTHIHLDHAGAAGSLVKRWPDLEVYVHERGAEHLSDPARLLESARRLYGDDLERLWGEVLPVPERNLRVLSGGERLFDGRFDVAYTPGHASHHVSYLHGRTAFIGDVGGVRIMPETLTIPPTPPPDIDIEAWHASIDQILRWKPQRLAMTHFGANDDIGEQLADLAERLDSWAALVHTEDLETFVGVVEGEIERGSGAANREAYAQAAPPDQLYAGLERYWRKREGLPDADEADGDKPEPGLRASAAEASTHAGRSAHAGRWMSSTD